MRDIEELKKDFNNEFEKAQNNAEFEQLRIKFLGRKGALTDILRSLKGLSLEEKRRIGPLANALRQEWENRIVLRQHELKNISKVQKPFDISRPGKRVELGHVHPISKTLNEIIEIFASMGFSVAEGPEIENEFYNFDALNIPLGHPAREMWDTFWLKQGLKDIKNKKQDKDQKKYLLRTHTSPVQIRYMESHNPPLRIISPGQVFRYEQTDATHGFQFRQVEGLFIDEKVSVANLLAVIELFFSRFFNQKIKARVRPSYFPFVEPGLEVDIFMDGKWLEVAGAGMVHPNVFKNVGYAANKWNGFAFGFGWERLVMMKYGISDVRLLYSGDLRFINQF